MKNQKTLKRFFDLIPGALTWSAIILPIVFSFFWPALVALYAIIFDLYWLYRSLYLTKNIFIASNKIKKATKTNWIEKISLTEKSGQKWLQNFKFADTLHVIIMPQYKENFAVVSRSIESYLKSNFPLKEKMIFLLTSEVRNGAQELNSQTFKLLKDRYGKYFRNFNQTFHPPDLPAEIPCKSSNSTWGARFFQKEFLDREKIDYKQVVVHNFDTDTQVYPEYFSCVAWNHLMTDPNLPTSYQPIHFPSDNIWQTGAVMRIVANSMTTADMHNSLRPHRFKNFSSRSDCFQTIVDIGYWAIDAIPEDSRQYYDSLYHYQGHYWVQPIYVPIMLDAVLDETWQKTLKTQYRQLRRWCWGVSDFSYTLLKALNDKKIPFTKKIMWSLRLLESHFSWAVAAIHISILGWLPLWLNPDFGETVLGFNLPTFIRAILNLAVVGLLTVIYTTLKFLPPKPKNYPRVSYLQFIVQWVIFPIVSLFFSSLAAIDAQTKLMLGRYLEYQVTAKAVKKN